MTPKPRSRATAEVPETGFVPGVFFMLKTVLISYLFSVILLLLLSVLATLQTFSNTVIYVSVNTITAISVLLCGLLSGRHFAGKGLVFGALCGTLYSVTLCIAGILFSDVPSFGTPMLTALGIGIICGAVGGIVGINTKQNRRR